jgi:hypothetical protein
VQHLDDLSQPPGSICQDIRILDLGKVSGRCRISGSRALEVKATLTRPGQSARVESIKSQDRIADGGKVSPGLDI